MPRVCRGRTGAGEWQCFGQEARPWERLTAAAGVLVLCIRVLPR